MEARVVDPTTPISPGFLWAGIDGRINGVPISLSSAEAPVSKHQRKKRERERWRGLCGGESSNLIRPSMPAHKNLDLSVWWDQRRGLPLYLSVQGGGIFTRLCSAACERSGRLSSSRFTIPKQRERLYVFQLHYPGPMDHSLSRVLQNVVFSLGRAYKVMNFHGEGDSYGSCFEAVFLGGIRLGYHSPATALMCGCFRRL